MPVKLLTTKLKCFLTGSARYKGFFFSFSFIYWHKRHGMSLAIYNS